MYVTRPLSVHFDSSLVVAPERRGGVAWQQFNQHYARLQRDPWFKINAGCDHPWYRRLVRLFMAWSIQRSGALLDLSTKAEVISRFPIPADPNIVFFGAEVGWEAALVRALFGDGGRTVLIDCDPSAHRRFLSAPERLRVRAPTGWETSYLTLERAHPKTEYVQADFWDHKEPREFDVGIDWGLLEHYPGSQKAGVLAQFRRFLVDGGVELTAVPRDTLGTRWFYRAFSDELNFGYRELLSQSEFSDLLRGGGFEVLREVATPTTCVALARVSGIHA